MEFTKFCTRVQKTLSFTSHPHARERAREHNGDLCSYNIYTHHTLIQTIISSQRRRRRQRRSREFARASASLVARVHIRVLVVFLMYSMQSFVCMHCTFNCITRIHTYTNTNFMYLHMLHTLCAKHRRHGILYMHACATYVQRVRVANVLRALLYHHREMPYAHVHELAHKLPIEALRNAQTTQRRSYVCAQHLRVVIQLKVSRAHFYTMLCTLREAWKCM